MRYRDLENYYLCAIGDHGKINKYEVGIFNKDRDSFSFNNADLELFKEPRGSNTTYVIKSACLQEIDDMISIV